MSKGSKQRPRQVSRRQYNGNWDAVFGDRWGDVEDGAVFTITLGHDFARAEVSGTVIEAHGLNAQAFIEMGKR